MNSFDSFFQRMSEDVDRIERLTEQMLNKIGPETLIRVTDDGAPFVSLRLED